LICKKIRVITKPSNCVTDIYSNWCAINDKAIVINALERVGAIHVVKCFNTVSGEAGLDGRTKTQKESVKKHDGRETVTGEATNGPQIISSATRTDSR